MTAFVRISFLAAVYATVFGFCSITTAGENYAFLVAVGDYDRTELKPLKFTRNDISEFRAALISSGYKADNVVHLHDDVTKLKDTRYLSIADNIREELSILLKSLEAGDSVIVGFAGHGVQFKGEAESYFCPRNARLSRRETLVSLSDVLNQLESCKATQKLLLVDACRNDPQTQIARSRSEVNLESVTRPQEKEIPKSLLAFFSCSPGEQSFEDPDLEHGVFFHHVLKGWGGAANTNGDDRLDFDELQSYVRRETRTHARVALKSIQSPQLKGDFNDEWILRKLTPPPPKVPQFHVSKATGMKLVFIPAGEFLRGSPDSDRMALAEEKPQHRVRLTRDFYIGQFEVTQGEWTTVMGTEPWKGKKYVVEGRNQAAVFISWNAAQDFCRALSNRDGIQYRLPTEAEWEYAARAGTTTRFSFGDGVRELANHGWYGALFNNNGNAVSEPFAHAVGLKKPNAFHLYDMHGNAYEWCQDRFDPDEYALHEGSTAVDPQGPASGDLPRVLRSGAWFDSAIGCRSAYRGKDGTTHLSDSVGFRIVAPTAAK